MRTDRSLGAPILLLLALLPPAACGRSGSLETRSFALEYLEPHAAIQLVESYLVSNPGASGTVQIHGEARVMTVRDTPDNLARIEQALAERDRPAPGVRLYFQVIEAGPTPTAPDPAIAEVEEAFREVLRFEGYRLAGEAIVRTAEGSEFSQRLHGAFTGVISGRLSDVQFTNGGAAIGRLTVALLGDLTHYLSTTVNLVDGRTVVVGTAGGGTSSEAIILVVRATFER